MSLISSKSVLVSSTYHDPLFRLREKLQSSLNFIKSFFKEVYICYTPITSPEAIDFLEENKFIACKSPSLNQVDTYNSALKLGLCGSLPKSYTFLIRSTCEIFAAKF